MKTKKKILKTILEISILILSTFGTFFLGYHYGTKTFVPIARYNYHLDNDGNIQSDNLFDINKRNWYSNSITIDYENNSFYGEKINGDNSYVYFEIYRESTYLTSVFVSHDEGHKEFTYDFEDYSDCYFYISQSNLGSIRFKVNEVCNVINYTSISFDYNIENNVVKISNIMFNTSQSIEGNYIPYEPFGTWYTPQTYVRAQWERNYSTLKQSKFDIVGYKEDGNYTSKPYYDELNIYDPFKREDNNKYYVSLEKVGFEDWDNSKTYEITQSFNNYVPVISPGYYIINPSLVDNFKQIQFSVKTGLQHEKYTSFNIVFGSNRTDAYYDFNNSWIYYYIPNSVVNEIRHGNDYYYEIPQFIIDSLQSRQVWEIKYSSLPNNSTSDFEEIEFYFDTSIFGYEVIYDDAYNNGYDVGYNNGRNDALNIDWLKRAISTIDDILNIQLLGTLTLGNIISIPLIIGIVSFVIGWFK